MAAETQPRWRSVVAEKRAQQKASLAPWLDLTVTEEVTSITDIDDADVLVQELAKGVHSAVTVTKAYIKRYLTL